MYLVFIGQKNVTAGKANKNTGNRNVYGDYYKFNDKLQRDAFYDDLTALDGYKFAVKGTINTLRKYSLGLTVKDYKQFIINDLENLLYFDEMVFWVNKACNLKL